MTDFKKFNNLTGWAVFLASLVVYILTIEETASFWDSGEFIAICLSDVCSPFLRLEM